MTTTPSPTTCPTCCRPAGDPHRRYQGPRVTEGCVDDFHDAAMLELIAAAPRGISAAYGPQLAASVRWHLKAL